jgi:putative DNA primase/helicase
MSNHINQFRQAIEGAGLPAPAEIHDDGKLQRFSTNGKRGDDSGWYCLHADGIPAGSFGCWRSGVQSNWCAKGEHQLTNAERRALRESMQVMKRQREADEAQRNESAAVQAAQLWEKAQSATDHPYLSKKGIKPHGAKVDADGNLLVAMRDADGKLWNVERINFQEGTKKGLYGGKRIGCYWSIGRPKGRLIVCEGYATGAAIHEANRDAVAVAFNAGNLEPVAKALRAKYPSLAITVAADDDYKTEGNPGLTKATTAAQAVSGMLAVPVFPEGRPEKATDFNDLRMLAGDDAVRRCFETAQAPFSLPNDWPAPVPLPDALPPVLPFDPDLLPVSLRGWVRDIAHRMQCPPDFPAVGAIVAASSLIGAKVVIRPKAQDDWQVTPNLWGLIVGRPGVMKSPALNESLKPLHKLQAHEHQTWQVAHEAWAVDVRLTELQADDNAKKARGLATKDPAAARALLQPADAMLEPVARRFIVNDTTVEKLGEILKANPWGTLAYRDEVYGLLTGLDRHGQEGARAFYLQAYDGNASYTFDRIGRGEVRIPRVCLSMLGGIQPGRIAEYVRGAVAGGSADDGLLQRFGMTVWPDISPDFLHVDQRPDAAAKQAAEVVFERLANLMPANDAEPAVWRFDVAAQALFVEWRMAFEQELKSGDLHPAMESHLSKYRKLIPALALIFALIDTPDSGGIVGEDALLRALAWSEYLRSHANRLYAAAVTPETTSAASLLKKIAKGMLGDEFTPRSVAVKGWAALSSPDAVRKAADVLVDFDWLRRDVRQTGGRPSERYRVNPAALEKEAA